MSDDLFDEPSPMDPTGPMIPVLEHVDLGRAGTIPEFWTWCHEHAEQLRAFRQQRDTSSLVTWADGVARNEVYALYEIRRQCRGYLEAFGAQEVLQEFPGPDEGLMLRPLVAAVEKMLNAARAWCRRQPAMRAEANRPAPPESGGDGLLDSQATMGYGELAQLYAVPKEALRLRLNRWREANRSGRGRDWFEVADAGQRSEKYLYRLGAIGPILRELLATS
jgi:hypothetical protein